MNLNSICLIERLKLRLKIAVVGLSPAFGIAPEALEALDMHPAIDQGLARVDALVM